MIYVCTLPLSGEIMQNSIYRLSGSNGDGDDSFARTLSRYLCVFGVRTLIQIRYAFVCMRTKVG